LVGWPNTGKSSLFNALAGKDRAIVSPQPGATRDYLSARLEIGGLACELIDTAGIEPVPAGAIEAAAQHASRGQRELARLELLCLEAARPLNAWERTRLSQASESPRTLIVLTKIDDPGRKLDLPDAAETSSATGEGIDRLRQRIRELLVDAVHSDGGAVLSTAVRCRESLRLAAGSLDCALDIARFGQREELVAAELRIALDCLGQVVGAVYTDDVLDRVFSRFCIGK
jgi:tRNA modification GTPase